ncbi:interleukin-36 alpha-like isoform X1 [Cervus elaphus]|uniref:interleukin-36 alpha-like isoform X1 n=1 Tax=Cervus canadensis TaxID=1574408 RepID=UPI001C9E3947|nr:interleukin-36 alpha-like isoform X1 [Cervus canadensis]XP_043772097.1 interleukin-36 alpha-like isoform X1 [Cervus elaphus]
MSSHLGSSETPSSKGNERMKGPVLSRIHPVLVDIQDVNHLVWVLQDQTLTAVPRKDQMDPVTVTLISCKYTETLEKGRGNPVYLGLKEPELCLFCTKVKGQPVLQLQEQNIMDLYHQTEPVKPFLFYHDQKGRASSFESVAFPGWFIGSCSNGSCPVIITQELGKIYTTDFGFTVLQA